MKHIAVDDETYALAERWATHKKITIPEAVSEALRTEVAPPLDPMATIGCMADEAEFLDQLVEDAMLDRATLPMRLEEIEFRDE